MMDRQQDLVSLAPESNNQAGFSLIEIILVLVLMGIMGAVGVFGLSNIISGFMMSREAATIAGKGQLALLRLSREFRVISSVSSSSATSISFVALHPPAIATDPPVAKSYTVSKSGSTITLDDGTNNDILVDQVNSLNFEYYDTYDNLTPAATWTEGSSSIIQLVIELNGPNATQVTFQTRITPRQY